MPIEDADFFDSRESFSHEHAQAICEIRKSIERRDWSEALTLLDRSFDSNGEPR